MKPPRQRFRDAPPIPCLYWRCPRLSERHPNPTEGYQAIARRPQGRRQFDRGDDVIVSQLVRVRENLKSAKSAACCRVDHGAFPCRSGGLHRGLHLVHHSPDTARFRCGKSAFTRRRVRLDQGCLELELSLRECSVGKEVSGHPANPRGS